MAVMNGESAIVEKTRELCQVIVQQPEFKSMRQRIDAFMANEDAQTQYQNLMQKGEMLQHKQQMGVPLSEQEISDFQQDRDKLVGNPIAKGFLEAQDEMNKVQNSVGEYLAKTFELGRIPTADDFASGSCGSGCGCH